MINRPPPTVLENSKTGPAAGGSRARHVPIIPFSESSCKRMLMRYDKKLKKLFITMGKNLIIMVE